MGGRHPWHTLRKFVYRPVKGSMKSTPDSFAFVISYVGKRKGISQKFKKHFFVDFNYDKINKCDWKIDSGTQIQDWKLVSNVLHSEVELALAHLDPKKSDVFIVSLYENGKALGSFEYSPSSTLDDWNHEQIAT